MVKLYHIVAAAREVDALVETAGKEADDDYGYKYAHYGEAHLACAKEVILGVGKHLIAQRGRECEVLKRLGLAAEHIDETGQIDGGEERADDTDDKGGGEALDGACAEEQEDYTCDNRGEVGVEDGREGVGITVGDGGADVLAGAEFFLGALVDEHVGVNCHTEGKHYTCDTREGQHCLERGEDAEGEEDVEYQRDVGDESGDESVEQTHEHHQEHQGDHKRPEAVVDGLFAERRTDYGVGDDVDLGGHLARLEYVGKVLGLVGREVAGDRRASALDGTVNVGGRIYVVVKHDCYLLADVGCGEAGPDASGLGLHGHRHIVAALLGVILAGGAGDYVA